MHTRSFTFWLTWRLNELEEQDGDSISLSLSLSHTMEVNRPPPGLLRFRACLCSQPIRTCVQMKNKFSSFNLDKTCSALGRIDSLSSSSNTSRHSVHVCVDITRLNVTWLAFFTQCYWGHNVVLFLWRPNFWRISFLFYFGLQDQIKSIFCCRFSSRLDLWPRASPRKWAISACWRRRVKAVTAKPKAISDMDLYLCPFKHRAQGIELS